MKCSAPVQTLSSAVRVSWTVGSVMVTYNSFFLARTSRDADMTSLVFQGVM